MGKARISRGKYSCAHCSGQFGRKDVQVDHIDPVIPVTGWDNFDGYIERLFCDASGLQVLCKSCHSTKSAVENRLRKK